MVRRLRGEPPQRRSRTGSHHHQWSSGTSPYRPHRPRNSRHAGVSAHTGCFHHRSTPMTSAAFALMVSSVDSHDIVAVTGEIDVTNAADFITSVDGVTGRRPLIVDLSGMRYLDSAG